MHLFKTSGKTYHNVIKHQIHAFAKFPRGLKDGDILLISKNKADCQANEKQIQYTMSYKLSRSPFLGEIETLWPKNPGTWNCIVECGNLVKLDHSFNLEEVLGYDSYRHYRNIQIPIRIKIEDEQKVLDYLQIANSTHLQGSLNENDLTARLIELCLEHHGPSCVFCGKEFSVQKNLGRLKNQIFLHQLNTKMYKNQWGPNPLNSLIPICKKCYSMIHESENPSAA
jgi:hypothetical protein